MAPWRRGTTGEDGFATVQSRRPKTDKWLAPPPSTDWDAEEVHWRCSQCGTPHMNPGCTRCRTCGCQKERRAPRPWVWWGPTAWSEWGAGEQ
eukprot:107001-Alexandrium_andersonii.AAC.1